MIDPQTQDISHDIIRRESRSLLSYIGDAFPWTKSAGIPALATLNQVVKEERAAVTALGRFLVRQRIPTPPLPSYPSHFTSLNFVALSYLLPRLHAEEQQSVAALESDLGKMGDAESKTAVEALLAVKKKNLRSLEGLVAPAPIPA